MASIQLGCSGYSVSVYDNEPSIGRIAPHHPA
jgi:hypothetical protein